MSAYEYVNGFVRLSPDVGLTGSNAARKPYGSVRSPTRERSTSKVLAYQLYKLVTKTACRGNVNGMPVGRQISWAKNVKCIKRRSDHLGIYTLNRTIQIEAGSDEIY